jgi:hypothetical protein
MRSVAGETKQLARPHRHSHSGIKETHPSRPKARILSTPRILHLSVSRGATSSLGNRVIIQLIESPTAFQDLGTKPNQEHKADNIRLHCVLQPVLVRPLSAGNRDSMNLSPERDVTALRNSPRRKPIPATVRELTDAQFLAVLLRICRGGRLLEQAPSGRWVSLARTSASRQSASGARCRSRLSGSAWK